MDFLFNVEIIIHIEVIISVEAKYGWLHKGVHCASLFLCRASRTLSSIDKPADATHLKKFILACLSHILVNFR